MIIIKLSKPFYPRWSSESARVTACVRLLVREMVDGRAGGLPSGPILTGLSRTTILFKMFTSLMGKVDQRGTALPIRQDIVN
jgi:hypothetical protein